MVISFFLPVLMGVFFSGVVEAIASTCADYTCLDTTLTNEGHAVYCNGDLDTCDDATCCYHPDCPYPDWSGDGYCDSSSGNNVEACDWDGGDCCESTCVDGDVYSCGYSEYDCQDPDVLTCGSYDCYDTSLTSRGNSVTCIGDPPTCDDDTCCASTCADYTCLDTTLTNEGHAVYCNGDLATCDDATCCYHPVCPYPDWSGDGYCDSSNGNNVEACDWDGGDCCESTCVDGDVYSCGYSEYDCQDPDVLTCGGGMVCTVPGDMNGDSVINIQDIVQAVNVILNN